MNEESSIELKLDRNKKFLQRLRTGAAWHGYEAAARLIPDSNPINACLWVCGSQWLSCHTGCEEVSRYCTRGESADSTECSQWRTQPRGSTFETQGRCRKKSKTGVSMSPQERTDIPLKNIMETLQYSRKFNRCRISQHIVVECVGGLVSRSMWSRPDSVKPIAFTWLITTSVFCPHASIICSSDEHNFEIKGCIKIFLIQNEHWLKCC